MLLKDLIRWIVQAQAIHEISWDNENNAYGISEKEALEQSKPSAMTTAIEFDIAYSMLCVFWNECQQWNTEL